MTKAINKLGALVSKDYITIGADAPVSIEEVEPAGAGSVTMKVTGDYVVVRPKSGTHQIIWLSDSKCADGGIVAFKNSTTVSIHIVELKSSVNLRRWEEVKSQFNGMLLNSLALLRLGGIQIDVNEVKCYLAFTKDKITAQISASPVLQKNMPGLNNSMTGKDWNSPIIKLPLGLSATFSKHQRDADGNLDLGTI